MSFLIRGVRNGMLAVAGLLLPLALACAVLVARMPARDADAASQTPNPARAPWYFLGPAELLVYSDVSVASAIGPWRKVCFLLGVVYVIAAVVVFPFIKSPYFASPIRLFFVSLVLGFIAASPWWYCVAVHSPN